MTESENPQLSFPCDYSIKIIGRQTGQLHAEVTEVALRYQPNFTPDRISMRLSQKGNFISLALLLRTESLAELEAVHRDLLALPSVKLLL